MLLSKCRLRKLRREKKLDKFLLRELSGKSNLGSKSLKNEYRKLLTTFSCNFRGCLTRVRALINFGRRYYVVTICDDLDCIYQYCGAGSALKEIKLEERATSFVLELSPDITTDEQALTWAENNMRGHCNNLDVSETKVEESMYYFYDSITEYRKLKNKKLVSNRRSSYPSSSEYGWEPERLTTTPDGVCVFKRDCKAYYCERPIICKSGNFKNNYLGLDDTTLFGYGSVIDDSIKEIIGSTEEIWDLETCQELNISACDTMAVLSIKAKAHQELVRELGPHLGQQEVEKKFLLENSVNRKSCAFRDLVIFDKYKRVVNSKQYAAASDRWQGTWKSVELGLLEIGLPLVVIENVIKEYVQPLRVTEDDLRKIRVKRWLKNLSIAVERLSSHWRK